MPASFVNSNIRARLIKLSNSKARRRKTSQLPGSGSTPRLWTTPHGPQYTKIFLTVLARAQRVEYLQYVITLLDDLLMEDTERSALFSVLRSEPALPGNCQLPFGPLFLLIRTRLTDWYLTSKAVNIITLLLTKLEVTGEEKTVFFGWLAQQLCKDTAKDVLIGLTSLQTLLRRNEFRDVFFREGGMDTLRNLIKHDGSNIQVLYQATNCLWLLSYNDNIRKHMTDPVLVSNLCEVCKHISKEKVIRMCLATLHNVLNLGENNEMMISCGLMRVLGVFANKKWGDEDIEGDIKVLQETLEKKVNDLTSFDMYKNELLSKKLDWNSPCHRSERFWRTNVMRFDEEDYRCLRILKQILEEEQNPRVLAVACWDIGEFVRYHPRGKIVIKQIDTKVAIMKLLSHDSAEVRKEALLSLQKVMVSNWEYLNQ